MKGPSEEERQMPFAVNQAGYYTDTGARYYGVETAPYYQQQSANLNGNNSGCYFYAGEPAVHGTPQGFYHVHPAAEPHQTLQDDSNPFAEYAWMADAEEFEKQVLEQMEQEEYLEACFQQMWEEEESQGDWYIPAQVDGVVQQNELPALDTLSLHDTQPSTMLNPNAAEFVPRWAITQHQ